MPLAMVAHCTLNMEEQRVRNECRPDLLMLHLTLLQVDRLGQTGPNRSAGMVSASDPAQVARDATCRACRHCTIIVVQSHNVCGKAIEIFGSWIGPLHLSYGGCRFFQSRLPVMPDGGSADRLRPAS
jgi:hypothetical protein